MQGKPFVHHSGRGTNLNLFIQTIPAATALMLILTTHELFTPNTGNR